jgi:hypothetical protein
MCVHHDIIVTVLCNVSCIGGPDTSRSFDLAIVIAIVHKILYCAWQQCSNRHCYVYRLILGVRLKYITALVILVEHGVTTLRVYSDTIRLVLCILRRCIAPAYIMCTYSTMCLAVGGAVFNQ